MPRKKLSVADEAVEDVAVEQPPEQPEIVAQIKPEILSPAKSVKQSNIVESEMTKKIIASDEAVEDVAVEQPPEQPETEKEKSALALACEFISKYRAAQVAGASYKKVGDQIVAYLGDVEIAKCPALLSFGSVSNEETKNAIARAIATAKTLLQPMLEEFVSFNESKVMKITYDEKTCRVISVDGRKYLVDLESGKVS